MELIACVWQADCGYITRRIRECVCWCVSLCLSGIKIHGLRFFSRSNIFVGTNEQKCSKIAARWFVYVCVDFLFTLQVNILCAWMCIFKGRNLCWKGGLRSVEGAANLGLDLLLFLLLFKERWCSQTLLLFLVLLRRAFRRYVLEIKPKLNRWS